MSDYSTLTKYYGYSITDFSKISIDEDDNGEEILICDSKIDLENPVVRIGMVESEGISLEKSLKGLLQDPNVDKLKGLIVGRYCEDIYEGTETNSFLNDLINNAEKFSSLEAIYMCDIEYIHWIIHSNFASLLKSFPNLRELRLRGEIFNAFPDLKHAKLETLIIETYGLPKNVLNKVLNASLPEISKLELWLGGEKVVTGQARWTGSIDLLSPIFEKCPFPKLKHLAIRNSEIADEVAMAVVKSSLMENLEVLDLSLGTLSDKGAETLLNSDKVKNLRLLDLHYHYISKATMENFSSLGIQVNLDTPQNLEGNKKEENFFICERD